MNNVKRYYKCPICGCIFNENNLLGYWQHLAHYEKIESKTKEKSYITRSEMLKNPKYFIKSKHLLKEI